MNKFATLALSLCISFTTALGQQNIFYPISSYGIGSSNADAAEYTQYDNDNNILVYGYFNGTMNFDPAGETAPVSPYGKPDLFLAKYNSSGNLLWVVKLGRISLNNGMDTGGMQVTSNNEIVIAGSFTNGVNFNPLGSAVSKTSNGGKDIFLAKYNQNGELMWINTYGSALFDFGDKLAIDQNDNLFLGIRFFGDIDVGDTQNPAIIQAQPGSSNAALIKFDSSGNYVWNYKFYSNGNSSITSIGLAPNGLIALGATIDGDNMAIEKRNMKLSILNSSGGLKWNLIFNNFDYSNNISDCLFSADSEDLYIAGRIQGSTEFDPIGENSKFISPLFADPFFAKYKVANGSLVYANYIESDGLEDYVAGINVSGSDLIIVGSFDNDAVFEPGNSDSQIDSEGQMDIFIAHYDKNNGGFINAETYGGSGSEYAQRAYFHPDGNLLIAGSFEESLDIMPNANPIAAEGGSDLFFAEFSYGPVGLNDPIHKNLEVNLFPVPAEDYLNISFGDNQNHPVNIEILNIVGTTVAKYQLKNPAAIEQIDVSQFNAGVYILKIDSQNQSIAKRFVKK